LEIEPRMTRGEQIAAVAGAISRLSSGGRARIRRGDIGSEYWQVWSSAGLGDTRGVLAERWTRFIVAVANFIGTGSGDQIISKESLGRTMQRSNISEIRFEKLIAAPAETRADLADRIVRQLAKTVNSINLFDLADLYLNEEPRRLREIAAGYYLSSH